MPTKKGVLFALGLAAATAALSSCSGNGSPLLPGPATSTSGSATPAPSSPVANPNTKAPAVPAPINASKVISDPCSSLSQLQLQKFDQASDRQPKKVDENGCQWSFGTTHSTTADFSYTANIPEGLSQLYAQNAANMWSKGYFEPTEIGQQPAVYHAVLDDRPKSCNISVATNDHEFFSILVHENAGSDGCKAAKNIATAVTETIKAEQ